MAKGTPPAGGFTRLGLTGTTAVPYSFVAKASAAEQPYGRLSELVTLSGSRLSLLASSRLGILSPSTLTIHRRQT